MLSTSFSFAFVSNSAVVAEKVQTYAQEHGWPLEEVRLATMEEALPVAKQLFDQGVDVILGGGGTGKLLRRHLNEPVVTISRSHMSILQALMEAREYTDNVAVTCYDAIPPWSELFSRLLHIRLQPIRFTNSRELTLGITHAIAQGAGCVVGGGVCVSIAQAHHCPGIVVCPGNEALERAFEEASNIAQARRRDREHAAWLQDVVDALHEGVIGVDPAGKLALSNPVARQALGQDRLRDGWALQHLGLAESLETGRPTEGTLKGENGQDLVFTSSVVVVDGIQKGALSVLTPDVVLTDLQRRLKHSRQAGLRAKFTLNDLLGESPSMRTLRVHAQRFAESDAGIYIHGESGTGKELLAHAIHNASPRRHAPFVAVNCGALPESLLESELFGYAEGAFTGARRGGKQGLFELAQDGTIFLDARVPSDFSGHNNVLYGHHMSDGSMFASISNYKQQWYYDAHPYFFLYTNAGKYRVDLFAGIVVPGTHEVFSTSLSADQLQRFINNSTFYSGKGVPSGQIVTLCTCSYEAANYRYVVLGELVKLEDTPADTATEAAA